jgi:hypothetical protein
MVRSLSMFLGNDGTTSVPKFDDDLFIFSVRWTNSRSDSIGMLHDGL